MKPDESGLPATLDIQHWTFNDRMVRWRYSRDRTIMGLIVGFELWPRNGFRAKIMTIGGEFPSGTGGVMNGVLWDPKPTDKHQDWVHCKPGYHYEFLHMPQEVKDLLDIKPLPKPTKEEVKTAIKEVDPFVDEDSTTQGATATPLPGGQPKPSGRTSAVSASRNAGLRPDNAATPGEPAQVSN